MSHPFRATLLASFLASLCATSSASLSSVAPLLAPSLRGGEASELLPLERALATIDPERIRADLTFISCDEMGGRDSPSLEQRIAARFIRARLQRLGWQPGAEHGYLFEYQLPMTVADFERTGMRATRDGQSQALELGGDYGFFPGTLADMSVEGGVVYVGNCEEQQLETCDLKDKWGLCYTSELGYRERTALARKAGALGLLVASPLEAEDELGDRCAEYATMAKTPQMSRGRGRGRGGSFAYTYLSHSGLKALLSLAGMDAMPAVGTDLGIQLSEERKLDESASVTLENVCGFWPGSDPQLSNEVLIVSAHYDHVGKRPETGDIFNGADDNGSGTCGLLALAEALAEYGPMRRSVMLIWVSAEEKGLLGSAAWTKNPWLPEGKRPVLDINIDMIGRNAPDQVLITPTKDHEAYDFLTRLAESFAPAEGFTDLGSADEYWTRSDHKNFYDNLHIPVCFLFADVHEDYHRPTDTVEKIDFDKLHRVTRLVLRMLDGLQTDVLPSAVH